MFFGLSFRALFSGSLILKNYNYTNASALTGEPVAFFSFSGAMTR